MAEVEMSTLKDVNVPEGNYINRDDLVIRLNNLFTTKKLEWLKNFSNSLKDKKDKLIEKLQRKQVEESTYILDLDDDFHIKQK